MAIRPVFIIVKQNNVYKVEKRNIEFKWHPGMSISQKQKSIESLHCQASKQDEDLLILEISSKSPVDLGVKLSAFNLKINHHKLKLEYSVESAFQSSKVFSNGGPYTDLLYLDSKKAKMDIRLKNSGRLLGFSFFNTRWGLTPKTIFYDWLYICALGKHKELSDEIIDYEAFSDIEFNPSKSINCQAKSAALYVALHKNDLLIEALKGPQNYLKVIQELNPYNEDYQFDKGLEQNQGEQIDIYTWEKLNDSEKK